MLTFAFTIGSFRFSATLCRSVAGSSMRALLLIVLSAAISSPHCVLAQIPASQGQAKPYHRPKFDLGSVKVFPEIHADRTVAFQISASSPTNVSISLPEPASAMVSTREDSWVPRHGKYCPVHSASIAAQSASIAPRSRIL